MDHPAVAAVLDAGEHGGRPFLVWELVRGRDLRTVLAETPQGLPVERALEYGVRVAEGLAAVHRAGAVHRNLRPANVMVLPDGGVKICDLGLPGAKGGGAGRDAVACVAPEQVEGVRVDGRADLYALGCLLFHLLTGREVFPAAEAHEIAFRHLTAAPPSARELRPCVPAELDDLLAVLLAKDPGDRPGTAAAVAEDLRAVADRHRRWQDHCGSRSTALLAEAERTADAIADPLERAEALTDVAGILVRRDPARARGLLSRAEQATNTSAHDLARNARLAEIAGVLAEADPAEAERIADGVTGWGRSGVRWAIAKSLARWNPAEAVRVANAATRDAERIALGLMLAKDLVERDPAEAERVANAVPDESARSEALWEVAVALAGRDPVEAERVADTIPRPAERASALLSIAEAAADRSPARASRLPAKSEQAVGLVAGPRRGRSAPPFAVVVGLCRIAELVTRWDPAWADRLLSRVERLVDVDTFEYYALSRALRVTAETMARLDRPDRAARLLTRAMHAADSLDDERLDNEGTSDREDLWLEIIEVLARWDPAEAERAADAVTGFTARNKAKLRIVRFLLERDPAEAERVADTIERDKDEFRALLEIAAILVERDPARASRLLARAERLAGTIVYRHFPEEQYRPGLLQEVAEVLARYDLAEAERVVHTITDPRGRDEALRGVAGIALKRRPAEAERLAAAVTDPLIRVKALLEHATTLLADLDAPSRR